MCLLMSSSHQEIQVLRRCQVHSDGDMYPNILIFAWNLKFYNREQMYLLFLFK